MNTTKEQFGKIIRMAWRPVAGLAGLVILVMWSSGLFESKVKPGKLESPPGMALPAGARTVTAKVVPVPSPVEVVGTVASEQYVNLSARLPAAVQAMAVAAGEAVTNGQVLATLDDRDLREQLAGAESLLRQAAAEYDRTLQLFSRAATTDQARLAALTQLEAARARVQQMQVMLSYTVITAPFGGIIADRRLEAGDLAAPGMILMSMYDSRRMRFEVPVPVRLLSRFALNREIVVSLDGLEQSAKGVVTEIVSEVDPLSRSRKVKIRLNSSGVQLMPGTYGHIRVEGDSHDAVWVPSSVLYRIGQQELVQVVEGERVIRRVVKTGVIQDDQVEVLSGLSDGEVILAEPVKEG